MFCTWPLMRGRPCSRRSIWQFGELDLCWQHKKGLLETISYEIEEGEDELVYDTASRAVAIRKRATALPKPEPKPLVYFVERDGFVKIGYSTNLGRRVRAISRGSCLVEGMTVGPVRLLATIKDRGRETEGWLHRRFDHLRVGGEWFLLDDELREFIHNLNGCVASDLESSAA